MCSTITKPRSSFSMAPSLARRSAWARARRSTPPFIASSRDWKLPGDWNHRRRARRVPVLHPVDTEKLSRFRRLLAEQDLDAVVVRAPDNILYLTDYWCMKGYDVAIFPREGDPILLVIEPQHEEARRSAWTSDVRAFRFYHPSDPRPPMIRSVEMALDVLREQNLTGRVGIE